MEYYHKKFRRSSLIPYEHEIKQEILTEELMVSEEIIVKTEVSEDTSSNAKTKKLEIANETGEKSFKCDACPKTFARKKNLSRHQQDVHSMREHACESCDKSFKTKRCLRQHFRRIHLQNLRCQACDKVFANEKDQAAHQSQVHRGTQVHKCDECGKKFGSKQAAIRHKETHRDVDKDKIDEKSAEKNDRKSREDSEKDTLEPKTTSVEQSGKQSTSNRNSKRHKQDIIHNDRNTVKGHQCDHCNRNYRQKYQLMRHLKNMHDKIKDPEESQEYKCDRCDKTFSKEYNVRRHLLRAHEDVVRECEYCAKIYELKSGKRKHDCVGPKCFKCDIKFVSRYSLLRHLKAFHETEYKCNDCGKRFIKRLSLNQHKRAVHAESKSKK